MPGRAAPDHGLALAAVHRSAGRLRVRNRLVLASVLLVGTAAFWLLTARGSAGSLLTSLPGALLWGLGMGGFSWLSGGRFLERSMRSLEASTDLTSARVADVGQGMVSVSTGDGPELAWRFDRQRQELVPGQAVWLARGEGGPVALIYCVDSGGSVTVLLSRRRRGLFN